MYYTLFLGASVVAGILIYNKPNTSGREAAREEAKRRLWGGSEPPSQNNQE